MKQAVCTSQRACEIIYFHAVVLSNCQRLVFFVFSSQAQIIIRKMFFFFFLDSVLNISKRWGVLAALVYIQESSHLQSGDMRYINTGIAGSQPQE